MKQLGMTYRYIEVPEGYHKLVASGNLPNIYSFLDKHRRRERKKDKPKPEAQLKKH